MDPLSRKIGMGAAGASAGFTDVEDVFSTFLYEGDAATRTITNDIDLSNDGGMVWIIERPNPDNHYIFDTERGANKSVSSNANGVEDTSNSNRLTGFNSDGFDLGNDNKVNKSGANFVSWAFRKSQGFFDVVTYTGNDTAGRTVSHNLGSAPGMIWVKRLDTAADNWQVYHRSEGATDFLQLNLTNGADSKTNRWNDTEPTATEFTLGDNSVVNSSTSTYVAYLFAHDDARFGPNADESIIKCGTYTGNGNAVGTIVDLGFRPQFVLIKRTDTTGNWCVFDRERGASMVNNYGALLVANDATSESIADYINFTDTGFQLVRSGGDVNSNTSPYVYMAIKDVHPDPTDGTDVLYLNTRAGTGSATTQDLGFYGSTVWTKRRDVGTDSWIVNGRSLGKSHWHFDDGALADSTSRVSFVEAQTNQLSISTPSEVNVSGSNYIDYILKRAKGAFTEFSYKGTGSATTIPHALGAIPQLWIVKRLTNSTNNALVGSMLLGVDEYLETSATAAPSTNSNRWGGSRPTSTGLALGSHNNTNGSSNEYHAMLFGNVSGIVDVGTYTGTGSAGLQVDCGFTAGARFVLIKNISNGSRWSVFDTARGITTSSSPYLELNQDNTETTGGLLDPYSAGFIVDSSSSVLNGLNEIYLYLAIA